MDQARKRERVAGLMLSFFLAFCSYLIAMSVSGTTNIASSSVLFEYKNSTATKLKIYYDSGLGFNERHSSEQPVPLLLDWESISLPLDASKIHGLRIDPGTHPGIYSIRNLRIVDQCGTVLLNIPLKKAIPNAQIASRKEIEGGVEVESIVGANDPFLNIQLNTIDLRNCSDRLADGFLVNSLVMPKSFVWWIIFWMIIIFGINYVFRHLGRPPVSVTFIHMLATKRRLSDDARNYRPDIDGLRALAVLSVLFFHLGVDGFPGGYLGVDVFFVISGFLITRLIVFEYWTTGTFSFGSFYVRRARRLFPALFVTYLVSTIVAAYLLEPSHLERFGGALIHAIATISNFYFWTEAGYFDVGRNLKPLLHTWSLSVEEQFYLVWPALLILLLKANKAWIPLAFLVSASVVSLYLKSQFSDGEVELLIGLTTNLPNWLAINQWIFDGHATTFYLLPFRMFELGIGCVLVWFVDSPIKNRFLSELLLAVGLGLVGFSFFNFTEETYFEGLYALVPCIGTALVIFAGRTRYIGTLLSNPISVWIGLISYSLYLIHWPLIVFWEYYNLEQLGTEQQILIVALSIALASGMYKFVERPFRRPRRQSGQNQQYQLIQSQGAFGLFIFILSVALTIPAANMWKNEGWLWRVSPELRTILADRAKYRSSSQRLPATSGGHRPFSGNGSYKILVVGDSISRDAWNALYLSKFGGPQVSLRHRLLIPICLLGFGTAEMAEQIPIAKRIECRKYMRHFSQYDSVRSADAVIYSARWTEENVLFLDLLKAGLLKHGFSGKVVVFNSVMFKDVPRLISRLGRLDKDALELYLAKHRKPEMDHINEILKHESAKQNFFYFRKNNYTCSEDYKRCSVLDEDNRPLYWDYVHWTLWGARFFGDKIVEAGELARLLKLE